MSRRSPVTFAHLFKCTSALACSAVVSSEVSSVRALFAALGLGLGLGLGSKYENDAVECTT
eukprot:scaffold9074_cov68-Skeletonema_marinoi.AAC.1